MDNGSYIVAKVADRLSKELDIIVTETRVRRYEQTGMITVKREKSSDYRMFTEKDIEIVRKIVMLTEVGIGLKDIKSYLKDPSYPRLLIQISNRVKALKRIIRELEQTISKEAFESIK